MTLFLLCATLWTVDALAQPVLCPTPKHVAWAGEPVAFTRLRAIGGESEQARHARGLLETQAKPQADEGARLTVRLVEAKSADAVSEVARRSGLPPPPGAAFPESYVLIPGAGPEEILLTGGSSGLLYGADTLAQLCRGGCWRPARISDWPTMQERGYTGCPRALDEDGLKHLDWFTRWRYNALYWEIYGDQGEDSVPQIVEDLARECRRRGILLYGLISNWRTSKLLGRPLCPCREDDLARVRRYSEELLDRGCQGLIFLFDDIVQEQVDHPQQCELCRAKYPTLAGGQLALLRPMLEVGRQRGITHFLVCPTPYYSGWKKSYGIDGQAYFREWGAARELQGVGIYHCLVHRDRLQEVFDSGLTNYVYWFNGLYDYFSNAPGNKGPAGTWGGLSDLAYSWYLSRWEGSRGTQPLPGAYDALRELPKLTSSAWLCGGGWFPWALWGAYLWDADRLDATRLRENTIARFCGAQGAAAYLRWEVAVRPALARLVSPDFREYILHPTQTTAQIQAAAQQAAQAAADFEASTTQPRASSGDAPEDEMASMATRMRTTAEKLLQEAERLASGRSSIAIGSPTTIRLPDGAVRNETRAELWRGPFVYTLLYSQTVEADGTKHRSQWHFGSGLGMVGPSLRNWYDAGFFDLVVNGVSLDAYTPVLDTVTQDGLERLRVRWDTDAGEVAVLLVPTLDGGLELRGAITPRGELQSARIELFAIPSAGWGDWEDMDKAVVTPNGTVGHGTPITLKPGEKWLFFLDQAYDVPHPEAEGPCAVVFRDPVPAAITTDNGRYVVVTQADLAPGQRQFDLIVYDFHGLTNQEALDYFHGLVKAGN